MSKNNSRSGGLFRSWAFALWAVFVLASCAQPPRIGETGSGRPEVIINDVTANQVRSILMARMLSGGMRLDSESSSRIVFSQEAEGFRENMLRLALGNSRSTPVRDEIAYTIINVPEGVKVFAHASAWTQMPLGQINRMELNGNKDFNAIQEGLNALRDSLANSSAQNNQPNIAAATRNAQPSMARQATSESVLGKKFDPSKIDELRPGISTIADAKELLGPTTAESTYQNGNTLLQWQYFAARLTGGSGAHAAILFDKDQKMLRVTHKFVR